MRSIILSVAVLLTLVLSGCGGGKYLEQSQNSENLYVSGEYTQSLRAAEQIIGEKESRGRDADGRIYFVAGASAFELGDGAKSLSYLEKAHHLEYSSEALYIYLAKNYRKLDNLSKEITALETCMEKYPRGKEIARVQDRLFETCLESENFELAEELWQEMDSISREETETLDTYMRLCLMQKKKERSDSLAMVLILKDPENETALNFLGEKHFWLAENSYQYQMKAYKENRTHKQYAKLLEAFKQVNADFNKSLGYFNKLYLLNPKPEYANYLANIHMRLEDKAKADYYRKRANL